jgi:uncharacterized lipoprotein YddW (UPF0748 family)
MARRLAGTLALGALLLPGWRAEAARPLSELRGLWVIRTALVSPQSVDRVVDEAAASGFNALFVQVRGRGDAFYESDLVARSPLLWQQPARFDPLARLVERARSRGLEVHAWVNVLLAAHFGQPLPRGHVVSRHPEWVMVPRPVATAALVATPSRRLSLVRDAARREGEAEGYYLSPAAEGVAEHVEEVVRELVRDYPLDGLHLDFIRYPGPAWDYSRFALEGFRRSRGGGDLLGGPGSSPAAWDEYRRTVLTRLTTRLADAARVERPGLVLSAAVAPDQAQAVHHKFQDWPGWLEKGVLGALCPMTYTPDNGIFLQQVEQAVALAAGRQPVWAGIGAYRMSVDAVVEKVALARQAGASGIVLFSHESLDPTDLRWLREQAFHPAVAAAARWSGAPGGVAGAR